MSNKAKGAVAGFLIVVAIFAFKNMFLEMAGFQSDPKSAAMLKRVANRVKQEQGLPRMIDGDQEAFDVQGQEGMLVYYFRLVKVNANEFDTQGFLSRAKPVVTERDCSQDDKGSFILKQGVVLRYSYVDKSDAPIGSFDVNPGDCGAAAASAPAHHEVWKKYEPQPQTQSDAQPETPWRSSTATASPTPTTRRTQQNAETPEMKAQALVDDGNAQMQQRNYDAAIKDFKAALALQPDNYAARSGLQEALHMR
jgi:hypothetical protein